MSITAPATPASRLTQNPQGPTFGGIVNSELIKLRTLRSTYGFLAAAVLTLIGVGVLVTLSAGNDYAPNGKITAEKWTMVVRYGVLMSQYFFVILGALFMTREYSTGLIQSSLTATSQRLPMFFAKTFVVGAVTFVVSFVSITIVALVSLPLLTGRFDSPSIGDVSAWRSFAADAVQLAVLSMMAVALGTIVRGTASGISVALGLFMIVPTIVGMVSGAANKAWINNISHLLPSGLGNPASLGDSFTRTEIVPNVLLLPGEINLNATTSLFLLIVWLGVVVVSASVLLKRRDA